LVVKEGVVHFVQEGSHEYLALDALLDVRDGLPGHENEFVEPLLFLLETDVHGVHEIHLPVELHHQRQPLLELYADVLHLFIGRLFSTGHHVFRLDREDYLYGLLKKQVLFCSHSSGN